MAKPDEQFLKDRLSMMESEGWLDLIENLEEIEQSVVNLDTMNNQDDLFHAKGQLHIIRFTELRRCNKIHDRAILVRPF